MLFRSPLIIGQAAGLSREEIAFLINANLLRPELFATRTFGCGDGEVISDLAHDDITH